jgi:acyl carrier protein
VGGPQRDDRKLADADLQRIGRAGIVAFSAADGLAMFDAAHDVDEATLVPMRLDLAALRRSPDTAPRLLRDLLGTRTRSAAKAAGGSAGSAATRRQELLALAGPDQDAALLDVVRRQAAVVLGYAGASAIDADRGLLDLGFDSLTAVELRNGIEAATGLRLPVTLLFDYPTSTAIARYLAERIAPESARALPLAELTNLERDVAAGGLAEPDRLTLSTRLRELLRVLDGEQQPPADVADRIGSAGDDEIFALIDNDLGVA